MSIAEKKLELFIAAFVLMLVWGVSSLMKNWSSPRSFGADIVYEMPRPKGFKGTEFDLSDREIDRRFVNPFDKKKAEEAKAQAKGSAEKNAIAAKASAEAAKKLEAARKAEADRKAKVTARIIEREKQAALAADAARKAQEQQHAQVQAQLVAGAAAAAPVANDSAKDDNKRSPSQWKALLSAQPTQANVDLMYAAVMKSELDQETYFDIVSDLLTNQRSETQELGIYAASKAGNSTAFITVASHDDKLSSSALKKSETFFNSFAQISKFGALAGVLQKAENNSLPKAIEIVQLAQTTKGAPVEVAGQVTSYATAFDKTLKPALEALAKTANGAVYAAQIAAILSANPSNQQIAGTNQPTNGI